MEYIDPLKRRMREQVLLAMVQPYQRVTVAFLAKELNLTATDVVSSHTGTSAHTKY
jgi:PCI domain